MFDFHQLLFGRLTHARTNNQRVQYRGHVIFRDTEFDELFCQAIVDNVTVFADGGTVFKFTKWGGNRYQLIKFNFWNDCLNYFAR